MSAKTARWFPSEDGVNHKAAAAILASGALPNHIQQDAFAFASGDEHFDFGGIAESLLSSSGHIGDPPTPKDEIRLRNTPSWVLPSLRSSSLFSVAYPSTLQKPRAETNAVPLIDGV